MADADQILHALLQNIAVKQKFTNYDLKVTPISSCGANYTSNLFLATISEGKHELELFAKVAAIGEKMRALVPMKLYDIERVFYTKLAKIFRQLEEKNSVPDEHRLKIPKFYGYSDNLLEEIIVLEDLTIKGYSTHDRFKSVDWEYAASAVTELAKLHALSVAYLDDDPEGSKGVLVDCKFEITGDEEQRKQYWDNIKGKSVDATKEKNKGKLKRFFETRLMGKDSYTNFYKPINLSVVGHGDYRPSNLMHKVKEDGSIDVIAVDYQTLRVGSPVVDLYYFIFTGTDAAFRAQHFDRLLDHYYAQFRAALARLGLDPDEKYTREDYDHEIKEKLPFGLAVAVFTLPVVTVEAEHAPKVDESLELSDFSIQNTSTLFLERLNGVIDDYVRWGVL